MSAFAIASRMYSDFFPFTRLRASAISSEILMGGMTFGYSGIAMINSQTPGVLFWVDGMNSKKAHDVTLTEFVCRFNHLLRKMLHANQ